MGRRASSQETWRLGGSPSLPCFRVLALRTEREYRSACGGYPARGFQGLQLSQLCLLGCDTLFSECPGCGSVVIQRGRATRLPGHVANITLDVFRGGGGLDESNVSISGLRGKQIARRSVGGPGPIK